MAEVYSPRHPERPVLYRVLSNYFDRFLAEYEDRSEREYGFFRPIVKEVVERYLDCGNPRCGSPSICQHLKHFAKICSQFVKRCALGISTGYARHITYVQPFCVHSDARSE